LNGQLSNGHARPKAAVSGLAAARPKAAMRLGTIATAVDMDQQASA